MNPIVLMQATAIGQPIYRPFMILAITLILVIAAVVYFLWRKPVEHEELSTIEKFRELVRAVLTASLTAGFVILTFEGKIDAAIFANTYGIIIAFLFGQKLGAEKKTT
jgi:ABC-type multidrug transport system permease subunit